MTWSFPNAHVLKNNYYIEHSVYPVNIGVNTFKSYYNVYFFPPQILSPEFGK